MPKRPPRPEPERTSAIRQALKAKMDEKWPGATRQERESTRSLMVTLVQGAAALMNRPGDGPYIATEIRMELDRFEGLIEPQPEN